MNYFLLVYNCFSNLKTFISVTYRIIPPFDRERSEVHSLYGYHSFWEKGVLKAFFQVIRVSPGYPTALRCHLTQGLPHYYGH